jgi:hypothetical protein
MKTIITIVILSLLLISVNAEARSHSSGLRGFSSHHSSYSSHRSSYRSSVHVRGYTRKMTGAYVVPHYRSHPDRTKINNWSTKGNINPFTGKKGTKNY